MTGADWSGWRRPGLPIARRCRPGVHYARIVACSPSRPSGTGAEGLRVEGAGCDGAECVWADGADGVGGGVEEVGGGEGVAAGVGEITRAQFCCGEVDEGEDAATAGGRWELVERGRARSISESSALDAILSALNEFEGDLQLGKPDREAGRERGTIDGPTAANAPPQLA